MLRLAIIIDNINEWIGRIFSWIIVVLTLLVVLEVILRRFFGAPTIWNFEVTKQLYGLHFMILAGFALLHNSHVSIDIIESKLPKRIRAGLSLISYILFLFPFCFVLMWKGYGFAAQSWAIAETSWSIFAPPLYPIKTVIPLTALLLFLQGMSVCIKNVLILSKKQKEALP